MVKRNAPSSSPHYLSSHTIMNKKENEMNEKLKYGKWFNYKEESML
jgi:hypothetical protein